ncbi:hypothetical protein BpHYR1_032679 [Brachionus plicatilis]|uniref:Uncharacterized protein n=1 Tax=Brachionus plicatilis TaxID=10195 RepID=A0A3M7PST5_BRAPC|nr:hypothetical protein BpHYR1_032679 [Brachionus plicatilis]
MFVFYLSLRSFIKNLNRSFFFIESRQKVFVNISLADQTMKNIFNKSFHSAILEILYYEIKYALYLHNLMGNKRN